MGMEKNEIAVGFDAFLKSGSFKPSTREAYRFCLDRWLHFLSEAGVTSFSEISSEVTRCFIEARKAHNISGGMLRRDIGTFRSAWTFLVGDVRSCPIYVAPRSLATAAPRGRAATSAEWDDMMSACCQQQHRHILTIAVETGLSEPELCNLQWRAVNLGHRIIAVRTRQIPISDEALSVFTHTGRVPGVPWVFSQDGRKLKNLSSWWVGVRDRSGVRDFRFRDIRHTFATRFINDGGDIHELAAILGVKLGAAGTYVHLTIEQLHDEIGRGKHRKEFDACSE
jgi:integrase